MNPNAGEDFVTGVAVGGAAAGALYLISKVGKHAPKLLKLFSRKARTSECNSFDGETLINTEFGLKAIKDIQIGDRVWAYTENTGETALQEVTHLILGEGQYDLVGVTVSEEETILATENHLIYATHDDSIWAWAEASDLSTGDMLWSLTNQLKTVSNIKKSSIIGVVYNLTVDYSHTYFIGSTGILAHNCNELLRPWSSNSVKSAANALIRGATEVTVRTRSQAEEVFLGLYVGKGYKNTTGMSGSLVKIFSNDGTKRGTYHWDDVLGPDGRVLGHGIDNRHGHKRHLQIHDEDGYVIHIFFD